MKINKILSALVGGAFLLGMAACTDEVDYTPTGAYAGDGVYFPTTSAEVEIAQNSTSCDIMIDRENAADELTVQIESTVTDADGADCSAIFTIPTSVTFAKGVKETPIVVSYDFNDIEPEKEYYVTIKILSDDLLPYGISERTFTLVYAPWSDWVEYRYYEEDGSMVPLNTEKYDETGKTGMATFTQDAVFSGTYEIPVYVRGFLVNDNKLQFGVPCPQTYEEGSADPDFKPMEDSPYVYIIDVDKTITTTVDGEPVPAVGVKPFDTTVVNSNYGESMWLMCQIYWYTDWYQLGGFAGQPFDFMVTWMESRQYAVSYYDPAKGLIALDMCPTIPSFKGTTSWFGDTWEYLQLPGHKDYSVTFQYTGNFIDNEGVESANIQAYKGVDAYSYAYDLYQGALTADQIQTAAEEIKANTEAPLVYDETVTLSFELTEEGEYTIVAVPYNEAGEAQEVSSYTFFYESKTVPKWKSIGTALYTDGLIYELIWNPSVCPKFEWDVEVQASLETPGLYRLVNPYKEWPLALQNPSMGFTLSDKRYYIYFNAQYNNATYMQTGELGLNFSSINISGSVEYLSMAYSYLSRYPLDFLAAVGFCGTVEDGVVSFPAGSILVYLGENGYYSNYSDELLDALDACETEEEQDAIWNSVPDPSLYGMGYTTIDMSGVDPAYAPGQETLDTSAYGVKKKAAKPAKIAGVQGKQLNAKGNFNTSKKLAKKSSSLKSIKGVVVPKKNASKLTAIENNAKM